MTAPIIHTTVLSRSPTGILGGVCEGLSHRYNVPVGLIRVAWLASIFLFGTGFLLYLMLWWVVPRSDALPLEPTVWQRDEFGRPSAPLARTEVDRMFLGVCGGLARRWQMDPSLVRLTAIGLAFLSLGSSVIVYLGGALLMPTKAPALRPNPVQL